MKNKFRFLPAVLLIALLTVCLLAVPAFAEDAVNPTVSFVVKDSGYGFDITNVGTGSDTDLFANFKNCMPGDNLTQEIEITNKSGEKSVDIYLSIEGLKSETVVDFLKNLTYKVEIEQGAEIFNKAADQPSTGVDYDPEKGVIALGTITGDGTIKLLVTLSIPLTLDNAFQDAAGTVRWNFYADNVVHLSVTVPLSGSKRFVNVPNSVNEASYTFSFVMTPEDSANPMPEGTSNGRFYTSVAGSGDFSLGELVFDKPGSYVYSVSEVDGRNSNVIYDRRTITITVTVAEDMSYTVEYYDSSRRTNVTAANFSNTYYRTIPYIPPVPPVTAVTVVTVPVTSAPVTENTNESKETVETTRETQIETTSERLLNPDEPEELVIPYTGSLTLAKTVKGAGAETDRQFEFVLTISSDASFVCTGDFTGTVANGSSVFLADGQSATISGLPEGLSYSFEEKDAAALGYQMTSNNAEGVTTDGDIKVTFTNTRNLSPQTGDDTNSMLYVGLITAGIVVFAFSAAVIVLVATGKRRGGKA